MSVLKGIKVELHMHSAHNVLEDIKEETSKGKPIEMMRRGSFAAKPDVRTSWEPGESPVAKLEEVKFDVNTEAMEGSGVKEVMQSDGLTMMKVTEQSRCANWDPGEVIDAEDQMFNVNVEVMPRGDVNEKAFLDAMSLFNFVWLYTSEVLVLVARNAVRFVDINPLSSRSFAESFLPILSDNG